MSEVQQILDTYKGSLKYEYLINLVYSLERSDLPKAVEALKATYELACEEGLWQTAREMKRVAVNLRIKDEDIGYDQTALEK